MKNATRDVNFGCRAVNIPSFEGQPLLAQVAQGVLEGESAVPELLDIMDATLRELEAERDRMRAWLAGENVAVREQLHLEVRATEDSFYDFLEWARACQSYAASFDSGLLSDIARALPVVAQRLQLDCLRLQRGVWSARGPGTHPGVNRLLHAGDDFEAALEQELLSLDTELGALASATPSTLLEPQRELLLQAADWMRAAPEEEAEEADWVARGEEWSLAWASLDLAFLGQRFSAAPTRFPSLNLALNTAWLRSEERVDPRLVACCLEAAQQSLRDLPLHAQAVLSEAQVAALADLESLRADLSDALVALSAWNLRGSASGLDPIRKLLLELADELWQHLESFPDDDPPREAPAG